ncbi:MAG: sigma-54-dependent Fis family transcriptional regulator [Deltaproteobacteria bacterium]|uniref:Sigma-54-dependent Fis family transcriptional regulator n=1 Tax=Candidatus Zymogenus saltonus TaxID=2844893 RepID=A0A9D8KFB9_9DELT|nr:sigma-54-dependent Fis family transcriptional regulator [Candidatus Zymogenus saltonus]
MKLILVVAENSDHSSVIGRSLTSEYKVESVPTIETCLERLRKKRYEIIFVDIGLLRGLMENNSYNNALQAFWQVYPTMEIVVMSPVETIREAVMAVKAGASNYITYPIDVEEVRFVTQNVYESIKVKLELDYLRGRFWESEALETIQTKCVEMQKVYEKVRAVSPTKSTVLLIGETGTGKSILARLIHQHSNRRSGPFISVHLGAVPETLVESELFGHEKGAFTGAERRKLGKFEIANEGTIFLDEISTIPPSVQIKLLEVLQDGTFSRIGSEVDIHTNARVIAATNTDLKVMCDEGNFRTDLYYRLNVFPIEVLPLRERKEDIPFLVDVTLKRLNKFYMKQIKAIHPAVLEAFDNYLWPGNIRELENIIERAYLLEKSSIIETKHIPHELLPANSLHQMNDDESTMTLSEARKKGVEELERQYLMRMLRLMHGRIDRTAQAAGITTRQLNKLMKKYGLEKRDFKNNQ